MKLGFLIPAVGLKKWRIYAPLTGKLLMSSMFSQHWRWLRMGRRRKSPWRQRRTDTGQAALFETKRKQQEEE